MFFDEFLGFVALDPAAALFADQSIVCVRALYNL